MCKQRVQMRYLIALSIGIFNVAWWPQLPDVGIMIVTGSALVLVGLRSTGTTRKSAHTLLVFVIGVCWAVQVANRQLDMQLPSHLDKQDFIVTGTIASLINSDERRSRFSFDVDSTRLLSGVTENVPLRSLLLSWYHFQGAGPSLVPGERWQVVVRLRRPRGMQNPGGFDYQSWLQQQGYSATGYVREPDSAKLLQESKSSVNQYRSRIVTAINSSGLSPIGSAVVIALSVGDKQQISAYWDDLTRLGIVHLLVISGLHIGLVGAIGFIIGSTLSRIALLFHRQLPSLVSGIGRFSGPLMAVLLASAYSLLAGFSLPTQRALIGLTVVMASKLIFYRVAPLTCMLWALAIIAISQPLAVLSAGFWLSFIAVGSLIWWFTPYVERKNRQPLWRIFSVQFALLATTVIPLIFFMGRASWLAPLVNIIAVPWVSLVCVPLTLIGVALNILWPELAVNTWQLADYSIVALWWIMDRLPERAGFIVSPVPVDSWALVAAILAALGCLLPSKLPGRWLLLLPLCALLIAAKPGPPLRLTVLDVGQGLAVIIEAADKTLVYDAGPSYGDNFSAGSGIIAPYLWHRGRDQIDQLVISHEDEDHRGGLVSLLDSMLVKQVLVGPAVEQQGATHCQAGHNWRWGEGEHSINFTILSPDVTGPVEGNNSSCVLLVKWRDQTILLPGDIERIVEQQLMLDASPINVLIAPHHGSKTSSTHKFVKMTRPDHVVFSSGYRHHFGHPHKTVLARYQGVNSRLWSTSEQGAISFVWDRRGELKVTAQRETADARWWR
jgi:competence protein ComEC